MHYFLFHLSATHITWQQGALDPKPRPNPIGKALHADQGVMHSANYEEDKKQRESINNKAQDEGSGALENGILYSQRRELGIDWGDTNPKFRGKPVFEEWEEQPLPPSAHIEERKAEMLFDHLDHLESYYYILTEYGEFDTNMYHYSHIPQQNETAYYVE